LVAQIGKIEVAGVSVSPSDIHAGTGLHVNFHLAGLFALVEWCGHGKEFLNYRFPLTVYRWRTD
jgi:hypothetical protein